MASNSNTVADEFGEYDDWVEIFNGGTGSVWLGDKYLSDNYLNPSRWQMPDVEIQEGEFMLFWADNDTEQGDFHTSFKLSAAGEEIGIYDSQENNYAEIEFTVFGVQQSDISIGRIPDGTGDIVFLSYATPGYSNTGPPLNINSLSRYELKVFPNPFNNVLNITFSEVYGNNIIIKVHDITGRLISENHLDNAQEIVSLSNDELKMNSGVYVLTVYIEETFGLVQPYESKLIVKD